MSQATTFIWHLAELADNSTRDRAPLARLRRALSEEPRELARVLPLVIPYAPRYRQAQDAYLRAACLFGLHPSNKAELAQGISLAEALLRIRREPGDSTEARFVALLESHSEDLPVHLRHCISLVASQGIKLKWTDILDALLYWDANDVPTNTSPRRRWAQDFWGQGARPSS